VVGLLGAKEVEHLDALHPHDQLAGGVAALAETARALEKLGDEGDFAQAQATHEVFLREIQRFQEELAARRASG
jgi:hypothetical protein